MMAFLAPFTTKILGGLSVALALLCGLLWLSLAGEKRHSAKLETRLTQTQAAFDQTVADVRAKTALAQAQDAAHVATVERNQVQATQEVSSDYQKQLAALRARYDALRVRTGTTAANSSGSSGAPVSSVPGSPSGDYDPSAGIRISAEQALTAEEIRAQLIAAQKWIEAQERVQAIPRGE